MRLAVIIISLFLIAAETSGKTIVVSPEGEMRNFMRAVFIAAPYDTVIVKKGVYPSINSIITKPLTIIGEDFPVIDGRNRDEVILVYSDSVNIIGLDVRNSNRGSMKDYAGIRVFKSKHVNILNCRLNNAFFGIYLSDSKKVIVKGCHSKGANYGNSDTGNGIHLWKCDSVTVIDNHMEGHRDGLYFEFAKHCYIEKNLAEKNYRYGLHFMFSDNDTYVNNTFRHNGTGVAVMYTKGVHMFNNTFEDNWGDAAYGLLLKDIGNSLIIGNTFRNNTIGVTMEGSSNMRFENNDFLRNGYGLRIWANCTRDTFLHNNFSGNTFDASTNGELQQNIFNYNYWDKYTGYDLNRDKIGDVPYKPVSLYSMLIEQMPFAVMLLRSFMVDLLDKAEKNIPSITPQAFEDKFPLTTMVKR
jgi:nitrous oxidase accessory protein